MKKNQTLSIRAREESFQYAFSGIKQFFKSEPNALFHLAATFLVVLCGVILRITKMEAIALILCIGFVWVAELFNTCIEKIMDCITTQKHPQIKFIKDIAAGAVLIAAISALITGCIIFIPKIIS